MGSGAQVKQIALVVFERDEGGGGTEKIRTLLGNTFFCKPCFKLSLLCCKNNAPRDIFFLFIWDQELRLSKSPSLSSREMRVEAAQRKSEPCWATLSSANRVLNYPFCVVKIMYQEIFFFVFLFLFLFIWDQELRLSMTLKNQ